MSSPMLYVVFSDGARNGIAIATPKLESAQLVTVFKEACGFNVKTVLYEPKQELANFARMNQELSDLGRGQDEQRT